MYDQSIRFDPMRFSFEEIIRIEFWNKIREINELKSFIEVLDVVMIMTCLTL